jgi:hypothetical protein
VLNGNVQLQEELFGLILASNIDHLGERSVQMDTTVVHRHRLNDVDNKIGTVEPLLMKSGAVRNFI